MSENEKNDRKKKRLNLFDWYYRDGKDLDKQKDFTPLEHPNFVNYFKLIGYNFGKLLSCNLLFIFSNFPIILIIIALSGLFSGSATAPLYQIWGPINGVLLFDSNNAEANALFSIFGAQTKINMIFNTQTLVLLAIGLFLLLFTFGISQLGTSYLYRNMLQKEPVFPFADFKYVVKKNFRQSFLLGVLDLILTCVFAYNIYYLFVNYSVSTMNSLMLFFTIAMAIVFTMIKPYAYLMIYTFDLPLTTIIKNSVLFVALGIKRNLLYLLLSFILFAVNYTVFYLWMPLGLILPFIITFSLFGLAGVYCAFPNVLKYMVKEEETEE